MASEKTPGAFTMFTSGLGNPWAVPLRQVAAFTATILWPDKICRASVENDTIGSNWIIHPDPSRSRSRAVLLPSTALRCHGSTVGDIAEVDAKAPVGWDVENPNKCQTNKKYNRNTHQWLSMQHQCNTNATPMQPVACLGFKRLNLLTFKSCSCPQSRNIRH